MRPSCRRSSWGPAPNPRPTTSGPNRAIRIGSGEGQYASWEEVPFEEYSLTFEGVAPAADGTLRLTVKGVDVGSTAVEGHISALCLAPAE